MPRESSGCRAWGDSWALRSIHASPNAADASGAAPPPAAVTPAADAAAPAPPKLPAGHVDFSRQQMLMMMFTCGQCETRAAKAFSKVAYTRGVVLLECPGCSVRHVVADHLGWFGAKGTVEDFAAERGGAVVSRLADNTLEITPEEVAGAAAVGRLRDGAAAAEP